jgi:hypothetical protein
MPSSSLASLVEIHMSIPVDHAHHFIELASPPDGFLDDSQRIRFTAVFDRDVLLHSPTHGRINQIHQGRLAVLAQHQQARLRLEARFWSREGVLATGHYETERKLGKPR